MRERTQRRFAAFARATARRVLARARTVLTTEPGQPGARDEAELAGARALAASAHELKGGVAKVAQLMGYLEGPGAAATDDARRELGALWDRAQGASGEAIRRVVTEDLGRPPEELFARWEPEPFAAASLGQVHGARSREGAELAVKVQYPGVADALRSDLASTSLLRKLAGAGVGGALRDAAALALRDAVLRELDYVAEAGWLARFRRAFAGEPTIVVPQVFPELSSARVLSAERLAGRTLAEVAARGAAEDRARAARAIFRFAWGAPLRHGILNADPNPGNYLVMDGGRVGFLDFGCAVELDEALVEVERRLWRAILLRDGEALRYAVHVEGLLGRATTLDSDTYRTWERFAAGPFLAREPWAWTPAYARGLTEVTRQLVNAGGLRLPAYALLLWRQRLGVASVIAQLAPTLDFRAELESVLRG